MWTPLREKRRSQAGLSMIEIVVTMVILTVVGTMLVGGWISLRAGQEHSASVGA